MIKLLSLICLVGGTFAAYSVFPNSSGKEKRITAQAHTQESSAAQVQKKDSLDWFEKYLDVKIPQSELSFIPQNYVNEPTDAVKGELSLGCWLGSYKKSTITINKDLITVDYSSKPEGFNKFLYITPNFFVLTLYLTSDNGMQYGSSIIYRPKQNIIDDLEGILVSKVSGNRIEGSREHYDDIDGYAIEYGHYNLDTKQFVVEFKD